MSLPAHIVIITRQLSNRCVFVTDGTVCFDTNNTAFIDYTDEQSPVKIGINDDTITISRFGEGDNYTMIATKGDCKPFVLNNIPITVHTTRLATKKAPDTLSAVLEYYFSQYGEKIISMEFKVVIKVTYTKQE